jgi:hypothetical protein
MAQYASGRSKLGSIVVQSCSSPQMVQRMSPRFSGPSFALGRQRTASDPCGHPPFQKLVDSGQERALLWRLTRREGIRLFDLVGFERTRLGRDVLLGLALIPACLVFILGGNYAAGWLWYGTGTPAYLFGPLPMPAALYGVLVFPFIWGLTEQRPITAICCPAFRFFPGVRVWRSRLWPSSGRCSTPSCR